MIPANILDYYSVEINLIYVMHSLINFNFHAFRSLTDVLYLICSSWMQDFYFGLLNSKNDWFYYQIMISLWFQQKNRLVCLTESLER